MAKLAVFQYKNHRGEIGLRRVHVDNIGFVKEPGFGYDPGWFISGICLDKGERRSFAFANILPIDGARHYSLLDL